MHHQAPWTQPLSNVEIIMADTKQEGFDTHNKYLEEHKPNLVTYSDGSLLKTDEEVRVGAGFTWTNHATQEAHDQSLSLDPSSTIYDAEFWAWYRGTISSLRSQWTTSAVFTDSKSIVHTFWATRYRWQWTSWPAGKGRCNYDRTTYHSSFPDKKVDKIKKQNRYQKQMGRRLANQFLSEEIWSERSSDDPTTRSPNTPDLPRPVANSDPLDLLVQGQLRTLKLFPGKTQSNQIPEMLPLSERRWNTRPLYLYMSTIRSNPTTNNRCHPPSIQQPEVQELTVLTLLG